jgi:hypothetical protein
VAEIRRRAAGLPRTTSQISAATLLLRQLRDQGWHASTEGRGPRSRSGEPIPWWTYPANEWFDLTLRPHHRVFEFGSGNSTLWLALRAGELHSVEHDVGWAEIVKASLPDMVQYYLVRSDDDEAWGSPDTEYLAPLHATTGDFDLVVVDGQARVRCAEAAATRVGETGLILLDDSDRVTFRAIHERLDQLGFGRLDFFGPRPGVGHMSTTSVFCRDIRPWTRGLQPPPTSGY